MVAVSIPDRIRTIVATIGEIDDADLAEDADLRHEYGLDSITILEIQAAIEREYGVVFGERQAQTMSSLTDIRSALDRVQKVDGHNQAAT